MQTLNQCKPGESVRVTRVNGEGAMRRRIMDMGITRGTELRVRRTAPLGDPMELFLRGYALSLRKSDAETVSVLPLPKKKGTR
ncbi:MAG: ferrous iron transport protein A [Clostridiales bacterium]|nr:ferrous iron transport protein A [Clostridiales bacterium]